MMKVTGLVVTTLNAVILLSSAKYVKDIVNPIWCWSDHDCPTSLSCSSNTCIDLCSKHEDRVCVMENHRPVFKCKPGFEIPRGSIDDVCLPVEWSCYVDNHDPDKVIKCNSSKWVCERHVGHNICGIDED